MDSSDFIHKKVPDQLSIKVATEADIIRKRIIDNIKSFDLLALLRLLHHLNYTKIWYQSNDSLASEARVIEGIEFNDQFVMITLNIGLLSPQSSLPSYIIRLRDEFIDKDPEFKHFIGYFDHTLLSNLLKNRYPTLNPEYFSDWQDYQQTFLSLSNLKASRTVHYIFSVIFPECKVSCDNIKRYKQILACKTRLGAICLGEPYHLGDLSYKTYHGIIVFLHETDVEISTKNIEFRLYTFALPIFSALSFYLEVQVMGLMKPLQLGISNDVQLTNNQTPLGYHQLLKSAQKGKVTLFSNQTYQKEKRYED